MSRKNSVEFRQSQNLADFCLNERIKTVSQQKKNFFLYSVTTTKKKLFSFFSNFFCETQSTGYPIRDCVLCTEVIVNYYLWLWDKKIISFFFFFSQQFFLLQFPRLTAGWLKTTFFKCLHFLFLFLYKNTALRYQQRHKKAKQLENIK